MADRPAGADLPITTGWAARTVRARRADQRVSRRVIGSDEFSTLRAECGKLLTSGRSVHAADKVRSSLRDI
jgi:hypothetical protein